MNPVETGPKAAGYFLSPCEIGEKNGSKSPAVSLPCMQKVMVIWYLICKTPTETIPAESSLSSQEIA